MPKININITNVAAVSNRIKSVRFNKVSDVRNKVLNVRNTLDGRVGGFRVKGKDTIYNRLSYVHTCIHNAETDLRIIEDILERAYKLYDMAENNLEKEVSKLDHKKIAYYQELMIAYKSILGNDLAFSSTHTSSSGRSHGGGGASFGNVSHGGGGRSFGGGAGGGGFRGVDYDISAEAMSILNSVYDKVKDSIKTVPYTMISVGQTVGSAASKVYTEIAKKYDDAIGSIETISALRDILVNQGKTGQFTELMGDAGLPSVITDVIGYGTSVVNCVNAAVSGDRDAFFENAQDIGISILDDVFAKGNPAISAGINMAVASVESTVEKGIEFLLDPSVDKFGDLVYSSTLKSVYKGATTTAYEIVEALPVLGDWVKGEYESLTGKSGLEGVFEAQKRLVNMVVEDVGFNGYIEGVKLMGNEIAEGAVNAKNAVVNGFKSIFT